MIEPSHIHLSVRKQCDLLGFSRSVYYYNSRGDPYPDKHDKEKITEIYEQCPFYGYRKITKVMKESGVIINHKKVQRLMKEQNIRAIYRKPNLSKPGREAKIYPYLLRDIIIDKSNKVWSGDITYINLKGGRVYLFGIVEHKSRKVMSWRLSNTLDSYFCLEALEEAIDRYGKPEIFNTDQGSQFSSNDFTGKLKEHGIRISMDGKGRAIDNVFIERIWRSLKYEEVYLKEYKDLKECRESIDSYFRFYNEIRPHQSLNYRTPDEVYGEENGSINNHKSFCYAKG